MKTKLIHAVGYASGIAAADAGCQDGPIRLQLSAYMAALSLAGIKLSWQKVIRTPDDTTPSKLACISNQCSLLAKEVSAILSSQNIFAVFGGDHSSAIGTWSGVYHAVKHKGPFGLIWIDAHMDSHTPLTSLTGNIHGMPLACLLGHGEPGLTSILNNEPKLQPHHICLIGTRSYEAGEADLLKKLKVQVFSMEEVKERGLSAVLKDALSIVNQGTIGYGLSLDIDSIDPLDAPGTGIAEAGGLLGGELCQALQVLAGDSRLLGVEVAEFDPSHDKAAKTEMLIAEIITAILKPTHGL